MRELKELKRKYFNEKKRKNKNKLKFVCKKILKHRNIHQNYLHEFPGISHGLTGLFTAIRILLSFFENLIAFDKKMFITCSNWDLSPNKYCGSWPNETASSTKKRKKKKKGEKKWRKEKNN